MNYEETLDYLYNSAPLFQHIGKDAYKAGLENTYLLDKYFNHPHRQFRTIHIAGTNGKGSCSHTLAAILQSAGYKTGLYTSPHLIDFREYQDDPNSTGRFPLIALVIFSCNLHFV